MIGRKIPCAGKKKSSEYGEFKKSTRVARKVRRAKRARKRRNGWMFGRKIRIRPQLVPPNYLPCITVEPEIITGRDKYGVEYTLYNYNCSYPRPPRVEKPYDPSYDYDIDDVVFTMGNEPGSIPISEKLSFIPPAGSNVTEVKKKKKKKKKKKRRKQRGHLLGLLHGL